MSRKTTVPVRMHKTLRDELKLNFPEIKMPELLSIMYRTSALRLENALRRKK